MTYFAHSKEGVDQSQWQTMEAHATGVARLTAQFSQKFCDTAYAENLGTLHDAGKYQVAFQNRLNGDKTPVEHAICGAQVWAEQGFGDAGAYCIAGHHGGLPDGGSVVDAVGAPTLLGRLKGKTQDFSAYQQELTVQNMTGAPFKTAVKSNVEYAFWIRMLYSCLTDADFLDTEEAVNPQERGMDADFSACLEKIRNKLDGFPQDTAVRKARGHLRQQIRAKADSPAQIHLMPLPTGAGKTLASMEFALERAIATGKKRIIYVIPYTSIIEQNAQVFRDVLGDCVLEHHCNFDFGDGEHTGVLGKLRRATENWDVPIVVTTNVQFFQSIYHNKSSHLRKLHNMSDSILVFDEAHMMPVPYFQPCLDAIGILTRRYSCEAVFLTATMPDFSKWLSTFGMQAHVQPLIADTTVFEAFRRYEIVHRENCSIEWLLGKIQAAPNALVVVNSRKTAKALYQLLPGKKFHLSTDMNHFDRDKTLLAVKKALAAEEPFTLVSTSLIEAGVDLDFGVVFRELAGLDNLLQTAGRCNREGRRLQGITYSFTFEDPQYQSKNKELLKKQHFTREIFGLFEDVTSGEAVTAYFDRLYGYSVEALVGKRFDDFMTTIAYGLYPKWRSIDFATYAKDFRFIDACAKPLVIPNAVSQPLLDGLTPYNLKSTRRALQYHAISLPDYEYQQLYDQGVIATKEGIDYLANQQYYNGETGISFEENTVYLF